MRTELLDRWVPDTDGPWDRSAAAHLLRRAGLGATDAEIELALTEGLERTLARLFAPVGHDARSHGSITSLLGTGSLDALQAWWLALMLEGGDPLRERMTLHWHDHFATSHDKVGDVRAMHAQNELFRGAGLGDFRELLRSVARDPAMLEWLDGNENRVGHPNENFARELLELFSLGIGNYAERDVQECARAFTGWGTDRRRFVIRRELHDAGEKELFGARGALDGDDALELVLAHPACPRHVARSLLGLLVSIPCTQQVVDALAQELVANDWSVAHALEVVLRSRLFFSPEARRARISSPIELVVGTARTLDASPTPLDAARSAARMGQALFRPPSVKGWDGGRSWINAGTWLARHNAVAELAASEGVDLSRALGAPADRERLIERALELLLDGAATSELLAALREVAANADSVERATVDVIVSVLLAPEYHFA